jgi:Zn-dependent protease with chaperone function
VPARAVLAVLLTIGFYALAIGLAVALLAVPYLEWTNFHRLDLRIAIFCVFGAAIILFSILPTIERFVAPGERVDARSQPRLFAELTATAKAVGEPMPEEVYLVQDLNAAVRQRGGVMGLGGRRVMLLGVPLMRILRMSEFRAVVAHEFGHYRGHTQLAPWIYKTREAIGRTLTHLSGHSALLSWPFMQYAEIFMMITQAISRQQELEADALAARTAGAGAFIAGLRGVHGASIAYKYYARENTPVYADGLAPLPEPDDSFMHFMRLPRITDVIRQGIQYELTNPTLDPYDSHPPLAARIAALQRLPQGNDTSHEPLAVSLLDPIGSGTAAVSASAPAAAPLAGALPWEDAGAGSEQFRWEDEVRRNFYLLRSWTVGTLSDLAPSVARVGGRLGTLWVANEEAARSGRDLLAGALGLALLREGWAIEASANGRVIVRKGDTVIDPVMEIEQLADGSTDSASWRAKSTGMGTAALRLDGTRRAA